MNKQGRPRRELNPTVVKHLILKGYSMRRIAKELGVGTMTVTRCLKINYPELHSRISKIRSNEGGDTYSIIKNEYLNSNRYTEEEKVKILEWLTIEKLEEIAELDGNSDTRLLSTKGENSFSWSIGLEHTFQGRRNDKRDYTSIFENADIEYEDGFPPVMHSIDREGRNRTGNNNNFE